MKPGNDERETIITFDETPADAVIFTYNKKWQKQLEQRLGLKPDLDNGYGGREYHLPKSKIRMPLAPRKYSVKQRREMKERLIKARHKKSPNRC